MGNFDQNLKNVTDFVFTDVAVNSKNQVFSGNYAVVADENGYFLIDRREKPALKRDSRMQRAWKAVTTL